MPGWRAEDAVDQSLFFLGGCVGVFVGNVYQPVGVPDDAEFGGVDIARGVVVGDDAADVFDAVFVDAESLENGRGDGRAFEFLVFAGDGVVFALGLVDADVVHDGGGDDGEWVAWLGLEKLFGFFEDVQGVVDTSLVAAENALHFRNQFSFHRIWRMMASATWSWSRVSVAMRMSA